MLSVQGKPGALEVADGDQREQPGHPQWEEEGQQVTNQPSNSEKLSNSLMIATF